MADALTVLKQDHRAVEELFERFEHLARERLDEGKEQLVREMTRALSIHAAVEERVFYPAVRRALPGGDGLAERLRKEHGEVEELLAALEEMGAASPGFDAKVGALVSNVRAHVAEEEGQAFPQIEERLDQATLLRMGEELERAKRTVPTHPHPGAPDRPPANLLTGPPIAALDRVRDARPVRRYAVLAVAAAVIGLIAWRSARRRPE